MPDFRRRVARLPIPLGTTGLVFLLAVLWLAWLSLRRLIVTLDEGIYLEGAARLLENQVPYRDFFTLTGPASFWLISALFRLLGNSLPAARVALVFDVALMTASAYWIARRCAGTAASALAAFCFLAFASADPAGMTVNHRWDGSAAALAAIVCALRFLDRRQAKDAALAGALAATAAWFTPSLALLCGALALYLAAQRGLRSGAVWFVGGGALVSAAWGIWLVSAGAWPAFLRHMAWSAANYARANRVAYGAINGGYAALFADCAASEAVVRGLVVVCLALPAILPVTVGLGFAARKLGGREPAPGAGLSLLLISLAALVGATFPRWDLSHLLQISALPYALMAWLLSGGPRDPSRMAGVRLSRTISFCGVCFAAFFAAASVLARIELVPVVTRAGRLLASRADLELVRVVERNVAPGEAFFVYPYMPLLYALSGGRNPTPYSFLQPGMMTGADEVAALAALERRPPAHIVYSAVPPRSYLWLFPSSDPGRLRMAALENFVAARYECVASVRNAGTTYRVLRPRSAEAVPEPPPPGTTAQHPSGGHAPASPPQS